MTYEWPIPPGHLTAPVWTGNEFIVDEESLPLLLFDDNTQGWDNSLTVLHEDNIGSDHYIDVASRNNAMHELNRFNLLSGGKLILEVGCSSGYLLKLIKGTADPTTVIIGADCIRESLERVRSYLCEVPLMLFDLVNCPLPSGSLDCVVLLNVLEHIENDAEAIRQIYRILKPGGIAIIEVPANPRLYDIYDECLQHYRRYRIQDIGGLFKQAGFEIVRASHLGFMLYPGFYLAKRRNQKRLNLSSEEKKVLYGQQITQSKFDEVFKSLLNLEMRIGGRLRYPFGIRCILTLRRPVNA